MKKEEILVENFLFFVFRLFVSAVLAEPDKHHADMPAPESGASVRHPPTGNRQYVWPEILSYEDIYETPLSATTNIRYHLNKRLIYKRNDLFHILLTINHIHILLGSQAKK